tara:strand:- start:4078 stop:4851 length:774 start_codon:yes stop_codon:yes gene_type:complete
MTCISHKIFTEKAVWPPAISALVYTVAGIFLLPTLNVIPVMAGVTLVLLGGGAFTWHRWGTLRWQRITFCHGTFYDTLTTDHPEFIVFDAVPMILVVWLSCIHILLSETHGKTVTRFCFSVLSTLFIIVTIVLSHIEDRGKETWHWYLLVPMSIIAFNVFKSHHNHMKRVLVVTICVKTADVLSSKGDFRMAMHTIWHVSSALFLFLLFKEVDFWNQKHDCIEVNTEADVFRTSEEGRLSSKRVCHLPNLEKIGFIK